MKPLLGGWYRTGTLPNGVPARLGPFRTLRKAEQYGMRGLSAIDPVTRFLTGPVVFRPGLLRRHP